MPELRTWYKTFRALVHLSILLDARQSFREFSMRSMRSCFFPDLLSIVQHSSLKPDMICLRRSTVLCLTLTLRPCGMIYISRREGKENLTSKSPQGSTADMAKDKERGLARHGGLASLWSFLGRHGEYTTPNTHVTSSYAFCC